MPRKKALDAAKLIKMIEDETPQAEIMKKMGFKTSPHSVYFISLSGRGSLPLFF
jgi:hypothetical protein